MNVEYNAFGNVEFPSIILCNSDKSELYSLSGVIYNTLVTNRFNALSDFTFDAPYTTDGGLTTVESYEYIQAKRLVLIENMGYYIIDSVEEKTNGPFPVKSVICKSIEEELVFKRLTSFVGTFKFYWELAPDPSNPTMMETVLALLPTWTIGTIDVETIQKYRTFSVTDKTVYDFLVNEAEKAYDCIFVFDIMNKTISAHSSETIIQPTDIFLSYDNLIKTSSFMEMSDELVTALYVTGEGTLDIRAVNPLGSNVIYNFRYYQTPDRMSAGLISALTAWENTCDTAQPTYAGYLTDLRVLNTGMIVLQSDLATLQGEYTVLETELKTEIQAGLSTTATNADMTAKALEIKNKQTAITAQQSLIDAKTAQITVINTSLSFATNFTEDEFKELSTFIFENTYQNPAYVVTDITTAVEYQDTAQQLYDQAASVLARVSVPRYEFKMDTANFVALKEFTVFTNQLELGTSVTVNVNDRFLLTPALLEIKMSFDDPTKFSLTFSNRMRLDGADYQYSDLLNQTYSTASSVSANAQAWGNWNTNYKDDVTTFISSALDASKNAIVNSTGQEFVINTNGLRGRQKSDASDNIAGYSPKEIWIAENIVGFTKDAWNTASLALGEIILPNGQLTYGLVADTIVGHLLAGNELQISNIAADGATVNFILDETGATLYNAAFTIGNASNIITLNAEQEMSKSGLNMVQGITIESNAITSLNPTGAWQKVFYTDVSGNLTVVGNMKALTGDFGGWTIGADGISDTHGNYINSNGYVKLGGMTLEPGVSRFEGDLYATNLYGRVVNAGNYMFGSITPPAIGFLDAGLITTGTLEADKIFWTGSINGPNGALIDLNVYDKELDIASNYGVRLSTPYFEDVLSVTNIDHSINMKSRHILLMGSSLGYSSYFPTVIQFGIDKNDKIVVGGPGGGTGLTTAFSITDIAGVVQNLIFSKGILTDGIPPNGTYDPSGRSGGTARDLTFTAYDVDGIPRIFIFTKGILNDGSNFAIAPIPPTVTIEQRLVILVRNEFYYCSIPSGLSTSYPSVWHKIPFTPDIGGMGGFNHNFDMNFMGQIIISGGETVYVGSTSGAFTKVTDYNTFLEDGILPSIGLRFINTFSTGCNYYALNSFYFSVTIEDVALAKFTWIYDIFNTTPSLKTKLGDTLSGYVVSFGSTAGGISYANGSYYLSFQSLNSGDTVLEYNGGWNNLNDSYSSGSHLNGSYYAQKRGGKTGDHFITDKLDFIFSNGMSTMTPITKPEGVILGYDISDIDITGTRIMYIGASGLHQTSDSGATWSITYSGPTPTHVLCLAPLRWIVSSGNGAGIQLWLTEDFGTTWYEITGDLSSKGITVAMDAMKAIID